MMNRYFILLLLPIVLFGCSNSPKSKPQQQSLAPAESSISNDSQTSEVESDVNLNSAEDSAPIATIPRGTPYSPQLVNNFMGACIQKGSTQTNCGCTLNTFEQNFSEPEYIQLEQQFSATGKLPEFVIQEIRNNCSNPEMQTPIARSQQKSFDLEEQRKDREMRRQQQLMSHEAMLRGVWGTNRRTVQYPQAPQIQQGSLNNEGFGSLDNGSLNHPCDYPNQRDSQGNYCGDRSAIVRPGGRF